MTYSTYGPLQPTQFGYAGETPVYSTGTTGQYMTPGGGMSIAPGLITSSPAQQQINPNGMSIAPELQNQQGTVLGATTQVPVPTQTPVPIPAPVPTPTSAPSAPSSPTSTPVSDQASEMIALQQAREEAERKALEESRKTAISGVNVGYENAQKQYGLARENVNASAQLAEQKIKESQAILEKNGLVSLERLKQDIDKYKGQTTREAEIARAKARKMAMESTRQARVMARALNASSSSDFQNILAQVENWALGQQGDISTGVLQAMDNYNSQAIRAQQDYDNYINQERAKTNQAIRQLQLDRDQKLKEITSREEMSLKEKNQAIKEINSENQSIIANVMSEFNDRIQGIDQWRTELEMKMQQDAVARAQSVADQQNPLELAKAQGAQLLAEGMPASDVLKVLGTAYDANTAQQALQGYYNAGGTTPEKEGVVNNAIGYLQGQGITRDTYTPPTITPYKSSLVGKLDQLNSSPFADKVRNSVSYAKYGPIGAMYGVAKNVGNSILGR